MPTETKTRKPRTKPVTAAVEAAKPARKPRPKKTVAAAPPPPPPPSRAPFPHVAKLFSSGVMNFARRLEQAKDSVLSMGAMAALTAAMLKKGKAPSHTGHHRRPGSRAHRVWAHRRASGRSHMKRAA